MITDRSGLASHLSAVHCMTSKQYSNQFGTVYTQKRHLECAVCQGQVVHTNDSLKSHLGVQSHGHLTPRDYFVLYVHGKEPVEEEEEEVLQSPKKQPKGADVSAEFQDWLNQSVYSCGECGGEFQTRAQSAFYTHIRTEHQFTAEDYRSV